MFDKPNPKQSVRAIKGSLWITHHLQRVVKPLLKTAHRCTNNALSSEVISLCPLYPTPAAVATVP